MSISITTPDAAAVTTISAQPTVDTVYHICARISEATQIPVQRQQLLFAGRELQRDGRTLAEHGARKRHGRASWLPLAFLEEYAGWEGANGFYRV